MLRCQLRREVNKVYFATSPEMFVNHTGDDYQYLHRSKVPTLHYQPSLPRLPIPLLHKSCEKYLRAQKPLRSNEEYIILEKLVKEFEFDDGPILQKELLHQDSINSHTSYISPIWYEMYLKDRKPLPINYNPFLVFSDDPKPEYNDQLIRGTNLLISSLRVICQIASNLLWACSVLKTPLPDPIYLFHYLFYHIDGLLNPSDNAQGFMKSLRENYLEPEIYHLNPQRSDTQLFRVLTGSLPSSVSWYGAYIFKAFPLDMTQYNNLFNTSRIPEKGIDKLHHDPSARHIIVMKNGYIYKMNVLNELGYIYDPEIIYSSLKWILNESISPNDHPVGILTTLNRDEWANARLHLKAIGNREIFQEIDSSILNLIFDSEEPTKDYKILTKRFMHSDGINRWFDKSFSLIIQKNGVAGLNFEHSWGDGVAILRYLTDIYKDSTTNAQIHPSMSTNIHASKNSVKRLDFVLDDTSNYFIDCAKTNYFNICSTLDIEILEFVKFGKNLCKKQKISPDSLIQLAFQIAQYELNKKFVSIYESCSTAAFKLGRTETMRPCTLETKAIIEALHVNKVPVNKETLLQMLNKCSFVHGNLVKEAAMGQGFDRHLFALQWLAQKSGKMPNIFIHPLHQCFNHYIISTSTLSSDYVMLGAFGPVVPDGFGIGYSLWDDRLGCIVSSYKNGADGSGYINCLKDALNVLYKSILLTAERSVTLRVLMPVDSVVQQN